MREMLNFRFNPMSDRALKASKAVGRIFHILSKNYTFSVKICI